MDDELKKLEEELAKKREERRLAREARKKQLEDQYREEQIEQERLEAERKKRIEQRKLEIKNSLESWEESRKKQEEELLERDEKRQQRAKQLALEKEEELARQRKERALHLQQQQQSQAAAEEDEGEKRRQQRDQRRLEREAAKRKREEEIEQYRKKLEEENRLRQEKLQKELELQKKAQERRRLEEKYKAGRVLSWIPFPEWERLTSEEVFTDGVLPNLSTLLNHFQQEGRLETAVALRLLAEATKVQNEEPNVVALAAPVLVCGDIHGQFFDLPSIFRLWLDVREGPLNFSPPALPLLLLGDYVDRGNFSTETVLFLCALKLHYPQSVYLLRGNHETDGLCRHFNFHKECHHKYSAQVYEAAVRWFESLPLAATVATEEGVYFCCHAGPTIGLDTLEALQSVPRRQDPPDGTSLSDFLWSDPADSVAFPSRSIEELRRVRYEKNFSRGCSYFYGLAAIEDFFKKNDLVCIVRGHQCKQLGYEEEFFGVDRKIPYVITLFSAPNYCQKYENMGALMKINEKDYTMLPFEWKEAPYYLNNFSNAFKFSLTFVAESMAQFCLNILNLCEDGDEEEEAKEEAKEETKEEVKEEPKQEAKEEAKAEEKAEETKQENEDEGSKEAKEEARQRVHAKILMLGRTVKNLQKSSEEKKKSILSFAMQHSDQENLFEFAIQEDMQNEASPQHPASPRHHAKLREEESKTK